MYLLLKEIGGSRSNTKNIYPIVPEGETVESTTHDTLGKDNISFEKVLEKAKSFLI